MDSIISHEAILFLSKLFRMQHVEDAAVVIAALFFLVSFLTATMLLYDMVRPRDKKKIFGNETHMSLMITALSMVFYMISLFGAVRMLDRIQDAALILNNPELQTTLSQQSLYTEIPLFIATIAILGFDIFYVRTYCKMQTVENRKLALDETGDIWG